MQELADRRHAAEHLRAHPTPMRLVETHQILPAARTIGHKLSLPKRSVVFHHGDPATHFYVVEHGTVSLQQYLDDGRRQLVEIILPGGVCGFAPDDVYHATCETLEPAVLTAIRKAEAHQHPELCHQLQHMVETQICMLQQHALALGRMTAQERVCALLVTFIDAKSKSAGMSAGMSPGNGACREQHLEIHMPMTRAEIGDYLGLSLETVCRTLTELQRMEVIEIGRHHGDIAIRAASRLRKLAGSCD